MSAQIPRGTKTWPTLRASASTVAAPAPGQKPLAWRVLALTGSFDTGAGIPDCFAGLEGDVDGQALTFGVLHWSFGRGTLQPLLLEMLARHAQVSEVALGDKHKYLALASVLLAGRAEQLDWARCIQDPRGHSVLEPWRQSLAAVGRTEAFQAIQVRRAEPLLARALDLGTSFGAVSERARALMFDILVQTGGLDEESRAKIRADFPAIAPSTDWRATELGRLRTIANRCARAAPASSREDLRARRLAIANGEGVVRGRRYDLEKEFGIRLEVAK